MNALMGRCFGRVRAAFWAVALALASGTTICCWGLTDSDCSNLGDAFCNPLAGTIFYSDLHRFKRVPRYLYVSNNGSNSISRFEIAGDGRLTYLGDTATPGAPWDLNVHPNSKYLYIAGDTAAVANNTVTVYSIDENSGDLTQIANVFHGDSTNQLGPWDVLVHPNGSYLYSSNSDQVLGDSVSTFDLGSDGVPVFRSFSTSVGLQPAGMVMSPDARFIYAGCVNGTGSVAVFQIQSDGSATFQSSTANCGTASSNIYDIALNPAGTILYSGSGGGVNGCGYYLPSPGTITTVASFAHNLNFRSGLKFSARGDTFFIANDMSEILTYQVDVPTGAIAAGGTTFLTGVSANTTTPNGRDIVVDETGRFVYALNDDGNVFVYRTDESEGFIHSQIQQTTAGTTPRYATIVYFDQEDI